MRSFTIGPARLEQAQSDYFSCGYNAIPVDGRAMIGLGQTDARVKHRLANCAHRGQRPATMEEDMNSTRPVATPITSAEYAQRRTTLLQRSDTHGAGGFIWWGSHRVQY